MKEAGRRLAGALAAAVLAMAPPAYGQDAEETTDAVDRQLADLYGLIVGTQATTRCAVFDNSMQYLTPLESAAAEFRLEQVEDALAPAIENIADVVANMRSEAGDIACGAEALKSHLAFNRNLAGDLVDVALRAWQDIDIDVCSYFADDDFMRAVARAETVSEDLEITGTSARVDYVERTAARWVETFAANCQNLAFDPTRTLPGLVALALPQPPAPE